MSWRVSLLDIAINDYCEFDNPQDFDVYQYGVFNGGSMKEIANILSKHKKDVSTFRGFDVFTGMPKETAEPIWQESWNPDILPDEFNVVKYWGLKTPEECAERVQTQVQDIYTSKQKETNVSVVAGLVEETLPVQENLKPALYVDFDLDIYSPTKFAFNYMMENNLIVPGTIIGYDDWGGTPGFEEMKDGESRAHREIIEEYGIGMQKLYQHGSTYPHVQTVWIVTEVK